MENSAANSGSTTNDEAHRDDPSHKERQSVKQEKEDENSKSSPSSQQNNLSNIKETPIFSTTDRKPLKEQNIAASQSARKLQGDELESAKAEMGQVMQENQRLKLYLDQIMKDYQALQMKFYEIVQQESSEENPKETRVTSPNPHDLEEEAELVSLTLGRSSSRDPKDNDDKNKTRNSNKEKEGGDKEKGLVLGLDSKFEAPSKIAADQVLPNSSTDTSFDEPKDVEAGETWPPSKAPKNARSGDTDEVVPQPPVKKARVSVRARCDTPTMNDGCQWRKYGQKIAKGNPCPRAYYRCTVAPSCPVRKQVQRCAEDMSILITTYEGTHNHPLPISATAMASTTSAAAYMLMSGSSSSGQCSNPPTTTTTPTTTTGTDLHGLSFNILDNSRPKPFYLPNPIISPAPAHPTITLDLTSTSSSSMSQFSRGSPSLAPGYSSTNLTFNSSNQSNNNLLPIPWPNGLLSYGTQLYNKDRIGSINIGTQPQNNNTGFHQTFLQNNNLSLPTQQTLPDTAAQAAKALTSDPSFQSVLTAALSSFIGNGNGSASGRGMAGNLSVGGENSDLTQKMKWGDQPSSSAANTATFPATTKGNGCATSSLLGVAPSSNSQPLGSFTILSNPLPFSSSKSTSTSPGDSRDHTK